MEERAHLYWATTSGQELLALVKVCAAHEQFDHSATVLSLKKKHPDLPSEKVSEAVGIVLAQSSALKKDLGAWAQAGLFTKQGLEQATHPAIADHHAHQFAGLQHVLEICTGAGFDTAALARVATQVTSIEADPQLAQMAEHNLKLQGVENCKIIVGKAEAALGNLDLNQFDGIWCDPSRRDKEGRRVKASAYYSPSLDFFFNLPFEGLMGIKVSPGLRLPETPRGWIKEWVGYKHECREQLLWHSTAGQDAAIQDNTVTLVASAESLVSQWRPQYDSSDPQVAPLSAVEGAYLIEPHKALVRCDAMGSFFQEHTFALLDEQIAYGVCSTPPASSSFYTVFKIIEAFPFNLKQLNQRLRALEWDRLSEVKKRGFPETTDALRKKIAFAPQSSTSVAGTVIVTRLQDKHHLFLTRRI
ncbi:methyltransferase domain-containing protein [Oligoflexia bacterium]|nr:methyltransferase domain-containing protein [Oligoflexia bacterium]